MLCNAVGTSNSGAVLLASAGETKPRRQKLHFDFNGGDLCRRVAISAKAGADLTVIMDYARSGLCRQFRRATEITAETGAKIKLVQLQPPARDARCLMILPQLVERCLFRLFNFSSAGKTYSL